MTCVKCPTCGARLSDSYSIGAVSTCPFCGYRGYLLADTPENASVDKLFTGCAVVFVIFISFAIFAGTFHKLDGFPVWARVAGSVVSVPINFLILGYLGRAMGFGRT